MTGKQTHKISHAHALILKQRGEGDLSAIIGDQWSKLLDFWWYMDTLDADGWAKVGAASGAARATARATARVAAWTAARVAAWDADWDAARDAARAADWASNEIQGASVMRERNEPFFFLPMFGFNSPDDIPTRPADYGVMK